MEILPKSTSNSSTFPVIHQPPQEISIQEMKDMKQQNLDEMKSLINSEYRDEMKIDELKGNFNRMSIEINKKEKLQQLEQVANLSTYPLKHFNSFCYDDDDDEDYTVRFPILSSTILPLVMMSQVMRRHRFYSKNARFDTKSYLLESLLNRVTLIASSPKFDSLLEEFSGKLAHTDLIPPGINEANCDPEEGIHLVERLMYDNLSPIPVEDRDNLFLERLLHDDPIPLLDILDFSNVVRVFLPFFTYPVTSLILLSFGSEDTIFDPDISDYHFSSFTSGISHRSGTFMKFIVYPNHLNESPMDILFSTCSPMDQ
uniref:Uncharacterized protein n=1 Tax=Tanacetum cinerariifolium TaxID=118510 RepID=A0A6L2LXM3_TANCI|nr:hypothetical protein [Tanacetum cinerariifolium]